MLRVSDDFLEHIDYWSSILLVNLLWVVCSLPLVTMPAATAGLFAVTARMVRGQPLNVYHTFFEAMREHWKMSTVLMLLNLGAGLLIAVNLSIFPMMSTLNPMVILSRSVTLFASLLLLMVNGYAWPLLVTHALPVRTLLRTALILTFTHPLHSVGLVLALILPIAISLFLPAATFVLITFSVMGFAVNWVVGKAMQALTPGPSPTV
jgi:uncharacterized membrane protein YesL